MTPKRSLLIALFFMSSIIDAMCPTTTPWSTPVQLSSSADLTSNVFSAATSAGFMAVWVDGSNNAHYSFSADGLIWTAGLIPPTSADVASGSNVFIAGNATGFLVAWVDSSSNGFSSFTADNGATWSTAIQINPGSVSALTPLNATADVYLSAGSSGFVATMIGNDNNVYVSFSNGTSAWSTTPTPVTTDGSVNYPFVSRQYATAVVVDNSCMIVWATTPYATASAYIDSINPLSPSTSVYSINGIGYSQSEPIVAALNGHFIVAVNANVSGGAVLFALATNSTNWATPSLFAPPPPLPSTSNAPWIAANQAGFLSTWSDSGNPQWAITTNNGFDWTPTCAILSAPSSSIASAVALSANTQGFVATWIDANDSNSYASFYMTPASAGNLFPPTNVNGSQRTNRFFTQSEYINTLTWNAPASGDSPAYYSIYRNAALTDLAGTVYYTGNPLLQFVDRNRQGGKQYSYYIVSVDAQGNVSTPAIITVP